MCGRFILETPWDTVRSYLRLTRPNDIGRNVGARYNIAPTQNVLLVHAEGNRTPPEGREMVAGATLG